MGREILGVRRERPAVEPMAGPPSSAAEASPKPSLTVPGAETDAGEEAETEVEAEAEQEPPEKTVEFDPSWVDNVKEAIPVEVVTAWAAIDSVLAINPSDVSLGAYWVLFGVFCIATAGHMWADVETPTRAKADRLGVSLSYLRASQWAQISLAVTGFFVWAYYLEGPFAMAPAHWPLATAANGWYNQSYATILLPLFVVVGPQLIPSLLRKAYGVGSASDTSDGTDDGGSDRTRDR